MIFRLESLATIVAYITQADPIAFAVLDPDRGAGRYAGEIVDGHVHRPWRVWIELADRLGLRLRTPRIAGALVELAFDRLDPTATWQVDPALPASEKYGVASGFGRIAKLEDPGFLIDLREAIERADLRPGARVLDLGVNTGDELALVRALVPTAALVGVDHSASALAIAQTRVPDARLIEADVNALPSLGLGRFDLVLSIGTLHSPAIDDREVLRQLVQQHLTPRGAAIFGFPNCRHVDGELTYGTRMKNYRQPELGLLVKDVAFYRKYLQQHHRRVFVTGRNYLLVTAIPDGG